MADNLARSRKLIKKYIGKRVEAKLDGSLFAHVPATFKFRFADPEELWEEIDEGYSDYLEEWNRDAVVPVAAVTSATEEFAWIFLDWREDDDEPGVVITTTDDWNAARSLDGLDELELTILK